MNSNRALCPHVVIHASAGSGKTFALSNRYLHLLAHGETPGRILATTFTRKAAAEILQRVLQRLAAAAQDDHACAELAAHLQVPLRRERAVELLDKLLRSLQTLQISTLDGFFAQIVGSYALDLSIAPGWRIIDEAVDAELRATAIQEMLEEGRREDIVRLMRWLSKGQVRRSISEQILAAVNQFHGIYLATTADAWNAIRQPNRLPAAQVEEYLARLSGVPLPTSKTFRRGWNENLGLIEAGMWKNFVNGTLGKRVLDGEEKYCSQEIPAAALEPLRSLARHGFAILVEQIVQSNEATLDLLQRFDRAYRRLKERHNALRFEDVTRALAHGAVLDNLEDLYYRIDGRLSHLLLDEFQDTSLDQWRVLRPIAEEIASHADGSRSFFCVGDVKQSIYGWRGAEPDIFERIGERLPGVTTQPLNCSYRSSPIIIDAVNRAFDDLVGNAAIRDKHRGAAADWSRDFHEHTTARQELSGYARLVAAPGAGAQKQEHVTCRFAAAEVKRLRTEAPGHSVGVLVRENDFVARMIYELRQIGIFASEEGGVRLTDNPVVTVVLSLVQLSEHPGDSVAFFHVAASPLGALVGLQRSTRPDVVRTVASDIRRRFLYDGFAVTVSEWIEGLAASCDERSASRLQQLLDLAYRYESEGIARSASFVRYVEKTKVEDPSSSGVRVMTVHQAKGLEFDTVVLPQLDKRLSGQQPEALTYRTADADGIERVCRYFPEEWAAHHPDLEPFHQGAHVRRIRDALSLLYVALTRPVHSLHMIVAPAKDNEKTLPETFAGVLRAALAPDRPCEEGKVLFELGDSHWYATTPSASTSQETVLVEPPRLAAAHEAGGWTRESPSGLGGDSRERLREQLRLDRSGGRRRGSLFHAWFEQIEWLDQDAPPTDPTLLQVGRRLGFASDELATLLEDFRTMLASPRVQEALHRTTYLERLQGATQPRVEVQRERRFALRRKRALLSGSFDRLVLLRDAERIVAAEVVDFKTDRVAAEGDAARQQLELNYSSQMQAYRDATATILNLDPARITGRLVFVHGD